jgi:hypothetical protein
MSGAIADHATGGSGGPIRVTFGDRGDAGAFRDDHPAALAPGDDGRERTVRLRPTVRDAVREKAEALAARSREEHGEETARPGQEPLTDAEREAIDFGRDGVNVPEARSIKAIFHDRGVSDWLAHADLTLTVDENRGLADDARSEGGGDAGLGREGEDRQQRRTAAREAAKHLEREADRAADRVADVCAAVADADADTDPAAVVRAWADGRDPIDADAAGLETGRDDIRTIAGELADPTDVIREGLERFDRDPDTRQLVDTDGSEAVDTAPEPDDGDAEGFDPLPDWSPADGGVDRPETPDAPETPPEPTPTAQDGETADLTAYDAAESRAETDAVATDTAPAEPAGSSDPTSAPADPNRRRARGFAALVYQAEQADGVAATAAAWVRLVRLFVLCAVEDAVNGVVPDAA